MLKVSQHINNNNSKYMRFLYLLEFYRLSACGYNIETLKKCLFETSVYPGVYKCSIANPFELTFFQELYVNNSDFTKLSKNFIKNL